jgi:hypothetical protein
VCVAGGLAIRAVVDAAQAAPNQLVTVLQQDLADEAARLRQIVERIKVQQRPKFSYEAGKA